MPDISSPWMYSSEEDVTEFGLVTPEFQEMAMEAQGEGESESEPNAELMQQAVSTMQTQASVIDKLLSILTA
jgi:hypothetical protein